MYWVSVPYFFFFRSTLLAYPERSYEMEGPRKSDGTLAQQRIT